MLIAVRVKMIDMKQNSSMKHTEVLVEAKVDSLENQFAHACAVQVSEHSFKQLAIANGSHPGFKKRLIPGDIRDQIIGIICD